MLACARITGVGVAPGARVAVGVTVGEGSVPPTAALRNVVGWGDAPAVRVGDGVVDAPRVGEATGVPVERTAACVALGSDVDVAVAPTEVAVGVAGVRFPWVGLSKSPLHRVRWWPSAVLEVLVGGTAVLVGGTEVLVGGTGVLVGGTGVLVGGTEVLVGGTGVLVGGTAVAVGGLDVAVGGTGVVVAAALGLQPGPPPRGSPVTAPGILQSVGVLRASATWVGIGLLLFGALSQAFGEACVQLAAARDGVEGRAVLSISTTTIAMNEAATSRGAAIPATRRTLFLPCPLTS